MRIISIFIILLTMSCMDFEDNSLTNNEAVSSIFNPEEIVELERIVSFIDTEICKIEMVKSSNLQRCYTSYFEMLNEDREKGRLDNYKINWENQKNLMGSLSGSINDEIWSKGNATIQRVIPNAAGGFFPDTIETLQINPKGKVIQLLESMPKENEKIDKFIEDLNILGDVSPSSIADLLVNYRAYNFSDEITRLYTGIHLLALNYNDIKIKGSYKKLNDDIKEKFMEREKEGKQ